MPTITTATTRSGCWPGTSATATVRRWWVTGWTRRCHRTAASIAACARSIRGASCAASPSSPGSRCATVPCTDSRRTARMRCLPPTRSCRSIAGACCRPAARPGIGTDRIPAARGSRRRIFPAARDRPAPRHDRSQTEGAARRKRVAGPDLSRRPAARRRTARGTAPRGRLSHAALGFRMNDTAVLDIATRQALAEAWGLSPRARFEPLGNGLINRTLLMRDDGRERVLQCLNTRVFRDPDLLMRNCHVVTAHLGRERAASRYAYAVLELMPTLAGDPALVMQDGSWWRMYDHVPGTRTFQTADGPDMAYE